MRLETESGLFYWLAKLVLPRKRKTIFRSQDFKYTKLNIRRTQKMYPVMAWIVVSTSLLITLHSLLHLKEFAVCASLFNAGVRYLTYVKVPGLHQSWNAGSQQPRRLNNKCACATLVIPFCGTWYIRACWRPFSSFSLNDSLQA